MAVDVLDHDMAPQSVDVWHDRAVFHVLTQDQHRKAYVRQVPGALRRGGCAIVGTFGPEGPKPCSGLPVARYDAAQLHDEFGGSFRLVDSSTSVHKTPWGAAQPFVCCFCKLER